jgi:hypothetical protein
MRWAARPTFYRDVGLISVGGAGFYVYHLEEVPVSATSIQKLFEAVLIVVL